VSLWQVGAHETYRLMTGEVRKKEPKLAHCTAAPKVMRW